MSFPEIPGYQIQQEIARGGMGVVYLARQVALDRVVALKVLNPRFSEDEAFVAGFLQEAKVIARLSHPNIVTVYDFGCVEGSQRLHYLAMQFVHGKTLHELLESRKLSPLESAQIIVQVADALDYAHREHVIHRDIKPGNIILRPDGKAMVMDFGVASGYFEGASANGWVAAGSPNYMSPEQCKGLAASPRSDQYSLAAMLFQMVTGRLPFEAANPKEVMQKQISATPPLLRLGRTDITPRMEAAMIRAMSKLPEMRFVTVCDFAREFEDACKERPAADILVGTAPGADPEASTAGSVSLVGGQAFATPVRSTRSSTYVTAVQGVQETRRRKSLVLVLLLLLVCGGATAAYLTYKKPVPVTLQSKKKAVKKPKRTRGSTRDTSRTEHAGSTSRGYSGPSEVHEPEPTRTDDAEPDQDKPPSEPADGADQDNSTKDDAGASKAGEGEGAEKTGSDSE